MEFLGHDIAPLGMGCWPIGGPMYAGDTFVGYSRSDDATSLRTIHAACDAGLSLFDTAAAYGAGHSERLLGQALKGRADVQIVTKIGIAIDEASKQLSFDDPAPDSIEPALDDCLKRLGRDHIDLVLLHCNTLAPDKAEPLFDRLDRARDAGKIGAYGWSTDIASNVAAFADRPGFAAIQHAMNVLWDAPTLQMQAHESGLLTMVRSPLAMGLLSGAYQADDRVPDDDIRATPSEWHDYFVDGRPNPDLLETISALRDLLTSEGRSLVQGALCWIWGRNPQAIPIPGARTPEQITELAGALQFGPLPEDTMNEIDRILPRGPDPADTPR